MLDCAILFAHHRDDDVTRRHLDLLRRVNPYPVVAVCCNEPAHVPEAVEVGGAPQDNWAYGDAILYRWFRRRGFDAERYVFLDWDSYVSAPVREWYDEVWDAGASAAHVKRPETDPDWPWFSQVPRLPAELRTHAAGMVPFNGVMLSHRVLSEVVAAPIPDGVQNELRLGTLVQARGFELAEWPRHKAETNQPWPVKADFRQPGFYHAVKG